MGERFISIAALLDYRDKTILSVNLITFKC